MNWFKQHIPSFFDVDEKPKKINFNTTEELLNLEIVKRYGKREDFSHFAISDNTIMEISNNGMHWWVVGFIGDPSLVDLPKWDGGKYEAELNNGKIVIINGNDVVSSCGGILTLKDGSTAKKINY